MSGAADDHGTLIVGLGNPILRDDRVGLLVARALFERLPRGRAVLREASVGGIELLHVLEGFRRALIIDALEPGLSGTTSLEPGEVRELALAELERPDPPLTPHNAGLAHCLRFGRACGLSMPEELRLFAIGVRDPYTFDERCTDEVARAIPRIVEQIEERVFGPSGCWARGEAAQRRAGGPLAADVGQRVR